MGFFHQATSQKVAQSAARKRAAQKQTAQKQAVQKQAVQKRSRPGAHQPAAARNYLASARSKPSSLSGWLKRLMRQR